MRDRETYGYGLGRSRLFLAAFGIKSSPTWTRSDGEATESLVALTRL
jgi:hypothetical protein